ncbi:MAG: hypothetical protein HYT64_02910 [Candidatus Yanofskybacteria bacterium]|nr:hypothetical protein [Candidatus Yanofskybacteria bacterium]
MPKGGQMATGTGQKTRFVAWVMVMVAMLLATAVIIGTIRVLFPTTNVVVGQTYNIMIYPCDAFFNKVDVDGKSVNEIERMYDVVFIGQNRQMMHQLVHPQFVHKVEGVLPGQGRWVQIPVTYPTVEGIKYGTDGWRREFQFNGTLQPTSFPVPECRLRS